MWAILARESKSNPESWLQPLCHPDLLIAICWVWNQKTCTERCKWCNEVKHSAVDNYSSVNILPTSRPLIQVKPPCKWLSCTTWGGLIMVCQPMLSPWSTSSGRWGRSTHPSISLLSWSTVVLVWGGLVSLLYWIAWCRGSRLKGMWISMNSWRSWECSELQWCRMRYCWTVHWMMKCIVEESSWN